MDKLNLGFSQYTQAALIFKARLIYGILLLSTFFLNPMPSLVTLLALITDYEDAIASTVYGRASDIRSTRKLLIAGLKKLGQNLMDTDGVTNEDLAKTGYDVAKKPVRTTFLPEMLFALQFVQEAFSGCMTILFSHTKVGNPKSFESRWTLVPNPQDKDWTAGPTINSTKGMSLKGFTPGTKVWFQIRAVGTNGPGPWTVAEWRIVV